MMLLLALTLQQAPAPAPADLIVTNARIYTSDVNRPVAQALAVRSGRIAYVGSNRGALALAGPRTERLDLTGKTVIAGMVDAHAHLLGLGQALRTVDLVGTRSFDEVIARVAEGAKSARPGEWIRGRGWDQNDWADTRFPTHAALSRAVPNNPVYLTRVDGHAALVNAKALELAQVSASTPDPSGGRLIRDSAGNPTGVLVDNAQGVVGRVIPAPSRAELRDQTLAAIAEANRWGLTGIHDAGVGAEGIAVYEALAKEGRYNLRNYVMIRASDSVLDAFMRRGPQKALYDGRLWIRSIKITADGALGSRGAALLEPYSDDAGNTGLITQPPERIRAVAARALHSGFQLNVHAIGDRANRIVLDQFEAALREVPTADHRFRIEHAQILHDQDIPRFAALDVIPSMQGSHQTSDMYWVPARLGQSRSKGAYAWRSLLNTGVVIPNGSDFPVEAVNPLISFHSFVTRQDAENFPAGGWMPEQRTTRQEALLSITLWPAYAAFMENESGSLTAGKYADFVVLDRDIMTAAPEEMLRAQVLMTMLSGRPVYRKDEAPGSAQ
ncbi:MAG TPA: amidohydrolase family protein [Gemmatimonadales bacterium]|nr:amidohydrolase family protein [Gemmatimonadales bacterium]